MDEEGPEGGRQWIAKVKKEHNREKEDMGLCGLVMIEEIQQCFQNQQGGIGNDQSCENPIVELPLPFDLVEIDQENRQDHQAGYAGLNVIP